jgi:hypothetical protein
VKAGGVVNTWMLTRLDLCEDEETAEALLSELEAAGGTRLPDGSVRPPSS